MKIEIGNNWPLMVMAVPKEKALQKESTAHLATQDPRDSVILDHRIERESNTFYEKGTFIDFYI